MACGGKTGGSESTIDGPHDPRHGPAGVGGSNQLTPIYCFGRGTRIATATGSIPIEDVRIGDYVQGFDLTTRAIVEKPVTEVFVHVSKPLGLLHSASGTLRVTANHPIYDVRLQTFVPAGTSNGPFQSLELASNWTTARTTIEGFEPLAEPENVYNLTVAEVHTYFANGILVHNKSRCGYPGDPPDCPCSGDECPPITLPGTGGTGGTGGADGFGGSGSAGSAGFGGVAGIGGAAGTSNVGGIGAAGEGNFEAAGGADAAGASSGNQAGAPVLGGAAGAEAEP